MDAEDLELFGRSIRHAVDDHTGAKLDAALDELGWRDAMAVEPRAAIATLFDLQGQANATSSALDQVFAAAAGLDLDATAAIVFPAIGGATPPGTLAGGVLEVRGLATAAASAATTAIVVATAGDDLVSLAVPMTSLAVRRVEGVDPELGLLELTAAGVTIAADTTPCPQWTDAVARTQIAVAHELVGASKRMLELAREHALERVQFGQPISAFQAVRHRLAETFVAIETSEALLDAAWIDGSPATAAMAKAMAGRQAKIAMRHCQQVCAGIGFTTEHPLHLSIRRALVLDGFLGSTTMLTRAFGDELVAERRLPPLLPL